MNVLAEAVGLVMGVDSLIGMFRCMSSCLVVLLIAAKSEGQMDREVHREQAAKMKTELQSGILFADTVRKVMPSCLIYPLVQSMTFSKQFMEDGERLLSDSHSDLRGQEESIRNTFVLVSVSHPVRRQSRTIRRYIPEGICCVSPAKLFSFICILQIS